MTEKILNAFIVCFGPGSTWWSLIITCISAQLAYSKKSLKAMFPNHTAQQIS